MTHDQLVMKIRRRMKTLDMTPYRLHKELKGKLAKRSVYNFVEHGKPVTTETLVAIMNVLKLSITEPEE